MAAEQKENENEKIVIIAGYGPGIGHAVALDFLKKGFNVALLSRMSTKVKDGQKLETTAETIKNQFTKDDMNKVYPIKTDLCDKDSIDNALKVINDHIKKKVAVIVYNAILFDRSDILSSKEAPSFDSYNRHYQIAINGLLHLLWNCQNNKKLRNEGDSIVFLLTGGGLASNEIARQYGNGQIAMLSSAKAAQVSLLHGLANTLSDNKVFVHEIRVNVFVGTKPEWTADKISPLYVEAYDEIIKDGYDGKKASLISNFPKA